MSVNICIWPDNGSLRGVGYVFHLPRIGDFALIAYQTVNGYRSHKARYLIALPEPASSGTRESNRKITITIHIPSYPIKLRFEHNKLTKGSKCHKNAQCDYFIIICRGNKEHKSSRTRPSASPFRCPAHCCIYIYLISAHISDLFPTACWFGPVNGRARRVTEKERLRKLWSFRQGKQYIAHKQYIWNIYSR